MHGAGRFNLVLYLIFKKMFQYTEVFNVPIAF